MWPPQFAGNQPITATVSLLSSVLIMNGTRHVTWSGVHFRHTRGAGVVLEGCSFVSLTNISIAFTGMMGLNISDGSSCTLTNSSIFWSGCGGVYLNGGDRVSLSPGHHSIRDCYIHDNNRWVYADAPNVFVAGVGQTVVNTEISNGPRTLMHTYSLSVRMVCTHTCSQKHTNALMHAHVQKKTLS